MENKRKLMILVAGLAMALALGGLCFCGFSGALVDATLDSADNEVSNTREGAAYGATATLAECARTAHDRTAACGDLNITCMAAAENYFDGCVDAVVEPDLSICEGAPSAPGFLPDDAFMQRTCSSFGWDPVNDVGCSDVTSWLETWCAIHSP